MIPRMMRENALFYIRKSCVILKRGSEVEMAGHSKWHNIKRRKESQDKKRAKIFTKISKEIYAAVREAGPDPDTNMRLRMALTKARAENIPNDNIERTMKKATGNAEGVSYEEMTYEGYGPGGVAVMIEVLTDNKNRSAADIRHILSKHGGNLGENGCVSFLFERKGVLVIERTPDMDEESLMLEAIEAGVADFESSKEIFHMETDPDQFETVKEKLEEANYTFSTAEIMKLPTTTVRLDDEEKKQEMLALIDDLEDHDDVQNVYHNLEG